MPKVLFDNREPITGKLRKTERYIKLRRLRSEAAEAERKAKYLESPKGLIKETIKGIPAAAKKVGGKILYGLKGGKYGEKQEERIKKTPEGARLLESIKTKGFLETYKSLKRRK